MIGETGLANETSYFSSGLRVPKNVLTVLHITQSTFTFTQSKCPLVISGMCVFFKSSIIYIILYFTCFFFSDEQELRLIINICVYVQQTCLCFS